MGTWDPHKGSGDLLWLPQATEGPRCLPVTLAPEAVLRSPTGSAVAEKASRGADWLRGCLGKPARTGVLGGRVSEGLCSRHPCTAGGPAGAQPFPCPSCLSETLACLCSRFPFCCWRKFSEEGDNGLVQNSLPAPLGPCCLPPRSAFWPRQVPLPHRGPWARDSCHHLSLFSTEATLGRTYSDLKAGICSRVLHLKEGPVPLSFRERPGQCGSSMGAWWRHPHCVSGGRRLLAGLCRERLVGLCSRGPSCLRVGADEPAGTGGREVCGAWLQSPQLWHCWLAGLWHCWPAGLWTCSPRCG